jgi:hypothetical protein
MMVVFFMLPSLWCMCAHVYWRICALPTVNSKSDIYQQWYKVDSCDMLHVCISDILCMEYWQVALCDCVEQMISLNLENKRSNILLYAGNCWE